METDKKVTDDTGGAEGQEPQGNTDGTEETQPTDTSTETTTTAPEVDTDGLDALPEWAQKEINKLRREAGKDRTVAKEKAAAEARKQAEADAATARDRAVEAARTEMADAIAKALGLKPEEAELTPDQVMEQLKKELDQEKQSKTDLEKRLRERDLEDAIKYAANMHDAVADQLLDSRAFMRKIADLDPDVDGYRVAVAEAVKASVEDDPSLKATKKPAAATVSGGNTVSGKPTKGPEDMTIDELRQAKLHRRS
jgi:hypothetical protein